MARQLLRGVSEYLLVLAGRELNWQTGIFYNCLGVVTINLFTMRSGNVDIFRFDKWVFYANFEKLDEVCVGLVW